MEAMNVPLNNRLDQKGRRLGMGIEDIGMSAGDKGQGSVSIGSEGEGRGSGMGK